MVAKEDKRVSPNRVRSFAPAYLRLLTRARVFSSSFAKVTCRASYSSYNFSFTTIPCQTLSSSFDTSFILLLQHGRGPGLVNFLCHNRHDVLLRHVHRPFLVHHLQHDHVPGLLLLLHHDCGLGLLLLLHHTGTNDVDLWRSYKELVKKLGSSEYTHSWVT